MPLLNVASSILPPTRWFRFKRWIYRRVGIAVGGNACIGSGIKIFCEGKIQLGAHVWLGTGAEFSVPRGAHVLIGECVDIGPNVKFVCGSHRLGGPERRAGGGCAGSIDIGSGTWIGTEVLILGGVTIGSGSVVGAGSVVLPGEYPPNALLAGVPARVVKTLPTSPEPR